MFAHFLRSRKNDAARVRVLRRTLFFSSPAEVNPAKTSRIPWFVRRGFRCLQVGVIAYVLTNTGYSLGLQQAMDYPAETERSELRSALPLSSATEEEIDQFNAIKHSEEYQRVRRIMREMIPAAKAVIARRLKELNHGSDAELRRRLTLGLMKLNEPWELVLFPNKSVNAYVGLMCPRKIFMFTGLLDQLNPTDDELAFIIGHELAHVVLGHCEKGGKEFAFFLSLQLMLLALVDPTGLSAMVFDCLAFLLLKAVNATFSRSSEQEADRMALEIAANACFDVRKGVVVMHKFALIEDEEDAHFRTKKDAAKTVDDKKHDTNSSIADTIADALSPLLPRWMLDSHPPSAERSEALKQAAAEMIAHFQTDFAINKRGWKVNPGDDLKSLEHINRPDHCYGVWGDLERCGIPFTKWLVY